jgi:hypothetical protein
MGKSIIELFESNKVSRQIPQPPPTSGTSQGGQFLIDRNNRVGNFLGNALGTKDPLKETAFEQETTGLRVRRFINEPTLYGTDIVRLQQKTTSFIQGMIAAKTNEDSAAVVSILKNSNGFAGKVNKFLGIPTTIYPSSLRAEEAFQKGKEPLTNETIAKIKKDAAGSLIGRYLNDTARGTPQQASKQVIGGGIGLAKGAIRNTLGNNNKVVPITSGSLDKFGEFFNQKYFDGNTYETSMVELTKADSYNQIDITSTSNVKGLKGTTGVFGKVRWSNKSTYGLVLSEDTTHKKFGEPTKKKLAEFNTYVNPYATGSAALIEGKLKNNTLLQFLKPAPLKEKEITRYSKDTAKKSIYNKDAVLNNELGKRRGLYTDRDILNQTGKFTESELQTTKINGTDISEVDLIPLRFQKVNDGSAVYVRSVVTGFNETFSPGWDSSRMLGHPFNFYNFTSVERKLTFNFKSYAMSQPELVLMWRRLEFISHCTYPDSYTGSGIFQPTLIYFTFGNLYIDKVCFIDSLSYTIDESENLWELGGDKIKTKAGSFVDFNSRFNVGADNNSKLLSMSGVKKTQKNGKFEVENNEVYNKGTNSSNIKAKENVINYNSGDLNMDHYKLPKIINASIGLTFIESRNTTQNNLYGYGKPISKSANKNTI